MRKTKFYSLLAVLSVSTIAYAQVGISTSNPQATFHVDGAKDNAATGTPTAAQQANDVVVTSQGRLGVGTITPANALHVKASADPVKLEGVGNGDTTTDRLLVLDPTGVVKSIKTLGGLSIPNPAVFRLETSQNNFLTGAGGGASQIVPMSLVKNTIPGLTYNSSSSTITFPAGTYELMFVYEGTHNASGCTVSSYFVDFPLDSSTQRIHSTAAHSSGSNSQHGGSIAYATSIPAGKTWTISLGRGSSGNCWDAGMTLRSVSTQFLVFRIGD
ncbi:hypothetical protein [Chryseobacterium sp. ERMR1:04]|uniref:hypothetical protein n=1 Tax=Chryseobacterium sp. ERMR1:04 TaxID=1705393 RepID=UPI0006C8B52D|nr:hypothetical protein [Chryseobacterium sp. ERMR1:04]KPH12470.1 hypothetical protein AMQ68_16315 [Chryseobacterium sp. ERMR1:04]